MTTENRRLDEMHHVAVAVNDIGKAVEWYTDTFACSVLYQDATWAYLEFSNMKLALVLPSQHPCHIAFEGPEPSRFGEVKTHRDGVRYVYLTDPFGNTVEVVGTTSSAARGPVARE